MFLLISVVPPAMEAWRTAEQVLGPAVRPASASSPMRSTASVGQLLVAVGPRQLGQAAARSGRRRIGRASARSGSACSGCPRRCRPGAAAAPGPPGPPAPAGRPAGRRAGWPATRCRRATPARSKLSVVMATDHPAWSGPSMAERGTRASVKKSSAKDCPPVMVVSGRASMPGVRRSTRKQVMPGVLLGRRVGAHVELAPVGEVPERVPGLLPVDHEVVAVLDRGGAQRGQVRAGVGLGHALGPDLVAAQHRLEEALLLLGRAELHDGRRDVGDADHVHRARAPAPGSSPRGRPAARRRRRRARRARPATTAPPTRRRPASGSRPAAPRGRPPPCGARPPPPPRA